MEDFYDLIVPGLGSPRVPCYICHKVIEDITYGMDDKGIFHDDCKPRHAAKLDAIEKHLRNTKETREEHEATTDHVILDNVCQNCEWPDE